MSLTIMEKFFSIQGEGARAGVPSVFVRFALCNFSCSGFKVKYTDNKTGEIKYGCDSYYSVDTSFKDTWKKYDDYSVLVSEINDLIPFEEKERVDIVITGGEPLMHWKNKDFQNLIAYYVSRGHKVTIETNASLDIEFTRKYQKEIIFSMSVKLSNSGEPEEKRINLDNITKIIEETENSYFKFVIDKNSINETEHEIDSILNQLPYYANVYLMPMGDTITELEKNAKTVMEMCMGKNFKYSDRLHIRIWDNQPGV